MNLPDALIGYTGFVGSNLDQNWDFQARFNSSSIADIRNRKFGTVVCAGISAVSGLPTRRRKTIGPNWKA